MHVYIYINFFYNHIYIYIYILKKAHGSFLWMGLNCPSHFEEFLEISGTLFTNLGRMNG